MTLKGKNARVTGSTSGIGLAVAADLARRHGVQVLHSGVDVLVNNAGIQFVAPVDEFPGVKWEQILATDL